MKLLTALFRHRTATLIASAVALVSTAIVVNAWLTSYRHLEDHIDAFQIAVWQLTFSGELPENATHDQRGTPACSWRFACDFGVVTGSNEATIPDTTVPWDSKSLQQWRSQAPAEYCFTGTPETNVMAVVGDGTAFDDHKRFTRSELPGDLILTIEVQGTGVHWMKPCDLDVAKLEKVLRSEVLRMFLGTSKRGFLVGFVDGEVWMLSRDVPKDNVLRLCSRRSCTLRPR